MRRTILTALSDPSVPCDAPASKGAFYYFVRAHTTLDAMTLTERLIRDHRVAVIPGSAFGATQGCYLRVSFGALDESTVQEGIGRLVTGLKALA
jgi:aspartate/methionine/tyrosine aminotransferase